MNNQTQQTPQTQTQQYPGQIFPAQTQQTPQTKTQQYPGQIFPAQTQQAQTQTQRYPGQIFPAQTQQAQTQTQQYPGQIFPAQTQQAQTQQYPGAANEIPLYTPASIEVKNVKDFMRPDGTVKVLFTLVCDNIIIHGMSLVPSNQTGQYFVAFPKRKGNDGKWYSVIYTNFDDATKQAIQDMVWRALESLYAQPGGRYQGQPN